MMVKFVDKARNTLAINNLGGGVTSFALVFSLTLFSPAAVLAQEETVTEPEAEDVVVEAALQNAEAQDAQGTIEEVVVTGSRLKRDTYSSVSPLQIIRADISKQAGLIDPAEILQGSTAAAGQQIDLTFQGFVLDNGPGASTVDLRGLGDERTLVLVNGRRLGPGGVEGAPYAPDINLIPRVLVQQYDLLQDAASSVYGSDAIAGVVNIILRKDFDGFEFETFLEEPDHDNGTRATYSLAWGTNTDRGVFGVALEHQERERVALKDRPWLDGCETNVEIDENGQVRTRDLYYESIGYPSLGNCILGGLGARTFVPGTPSGSIYYTPGSSNGGWGNWTESADPYIRRAIDGDGDGVADVDFNDYNTNGNSSTLNADLFPKISLTNFMAYGEYTLEGEANLTPYFEANYTLRKFESNRGEGQFFPDVPANNPFNLCNPNQPNGIDCGLAFDAYLDNPNVAAAIARRFGATPAQFREAGTDLYLGAIGPRETTPIVAVRGDRNLTETETKQARLVVGLRGDLPFMNFGTLGNWSFDTFISYSKSEGDSERYGIREDRLELSLGDYSTTTTPCENDTGQVLAPDAAPGCVPVNLYAPSLFPVGQLTGDFGTQAERDYLFGIREFNTVYEQTLVSAYATGDIFSLPAGEVSLGLGAEYRIDEIDSDPNAVARDGLFWGFFSDRGAKGERDTQEWFAELEVPILADRFLATELNINVSARITDDEYYGKNSTEAVKIGWRPFDSLLLRGTWGTAFRAPNLRELFLQGTTGFLNVFDPCYVPEDALSGITQDYDPTLDDREQEVLANCRASGVDPTLANVGGLNVFSTEVSAGGSLALEPEESESWTLGFAFEQPYTDKFDLSLSVNVYKITVESTVIEPSASFIVGDCYGDESGTANSVFCQRITRDFSDPTDPRITFLDRGFINRDQERVRGIDYNFLLQDQINLWGRPIDLTIGIDAHRLLERSTLFTNADGTPDEDKYRGEWGFPTWRAQSNIRLDLDKWRLTWEARFLGAVDQDPLIADDFSDINSSPRSDTCLGPPDDVLCRDYAAADRYWRHSLSLYYFADTWTLGGGVRNLFEEDLPQVDGSEITSFSNTPLGYGYDVNGRTYYLNFEYRLGGNQ